MKHRPENAPGSFRVYEPKPGPELSEENARYLGGVLRLRPGDVFLITDGGEQEFTAVFQGKRACTIGASTRPGREAEQVVVLFPALTKGDSMEWVIEKGIELGVTRIVPVISQHCVVRESGRGKIERWRKIAVTAMLQCGGCRLPEVLEPIPLALLPKPGADVRALLLHEKLVESGESSPVGEPAKMDFSTGRGALPREHWILSGPEGGFSDDEVGQLLAAGWVSRWLGPRRLRAETAPLAALSALLLGQW